jgi:hypothetical protein
MHTHRQPQIQTATYAQAHTYTYTYTRIHVFTQGHKGMDSICELHGVCVCGIRYILNGGGELPAWPVRAACERGLDRRHPTDKQLLQGELDVVSLML